MRSRRHSPTTDRWPDPDKRLFGAAFLCIEDAATVSGLEVRESSAYRAGSAAADRPLPCYTECQQAQEILRDVPPRQDTFLLDSTNGNMYYLNRIADFLDGGLGIDDSDRVYYLGNLAPGYVLAQDGLCPKPFEPR